MKALFAIAAASLFAVAACGGPQQVAGATGGTVTATLKDTGISLDKSTVPAGAVTFVVKNVGTITHELVVIRTDVAIDKIPADPDEAGKVSEDGSKGESGDLDKGVSNTFTLNLDPGKYVLICNEVGHYAMGMRIALTVTK